MANNNTAHTATDSVETPFVPMYPKGITDTVGNDFQTVEISELPEIVPPKGHEGTPLSTPYVLESTIMMLIVVAFLLFASSYRRGRNYFLQFITRPLSVRTRENAFEDRTIKDTFILVSFLANTIISQGIILYYALVHFDAISAATTEIMTKQLGICIGASAVYFIFKLFFYKILCYTFGSPDSSRLTTEGFTSTQVILGFFLLPFATLITISGSNLSLFLILSAIVIILTQTIVILRSFKVFFHKIQDILYFISYLCAVEIVPYILIIYSTIFTCNT